MDKVVEGQNIYALSVKKLIPLGCHAASKIHFFPLIAILYYNSSNTYYEIDKQNFYQYCNG